MVLPIFNFGVNFFSINLIRASNFINNIFILIIWTISLMVLSIFNFGVNFFSQYNTQLYFSWYLMLGGTWWHVWEAEAGAADVKRG
jgi:hypothetical protein